MACVRRCGDRLESVCSGVEQRTGKVDPWRRSNQNQQWLAAVLPDIEPHSGQCAGIAPSQFQLESERPQS
jgi:hypothetical protein